MTKFFNYLQEIKLKHQENKIPEKIAEIYSVLFMQCKELTIKLVLLVHDNISLVQDNIIF